MPRPRRLDAPDASELEGMSEAQSRKCPMPRCGVFVSLVVLVLIHAPLALAQNAAPGFSLGGTVLDSFHAPIAGAAFWEIGRAHV